MLGMAMRSIDACHRNQPNKSNLVQYKPLIHLKQLYMSNNMERFSYKGGCGILISRSSKN